MWARRIRYNHYFQTLIEKNYDYVLTAHHANDNCETIIMNLDNGCSINGLKGIPSINGKIVRPLIGYEKIKLDGRRLLKAIKGQMLDVNAIAKGWGVDEVFEYLKSQKLSNFMVEIGGEVRALGLNNKASSWKIGIDKPSENNQPGVDIVAIISLDDKAMATSGNYRNFFEFDGEKYSHIIDPRNGKSTQSSVVSVSVLGPNCMDADVLATALSVLSLNEGKALIDSLDNFEAYWIIKDISGNFETKSSMKMPVINEL